MFFFLCVVDKFVLFLAKFSFCGSYRNLFLHYSKDRVERDLHEKRSCKIFSVYPKFIIKGPRSIYY